MKHVTKIKGEDSLKNYRKGLKAKGDTEAKLIYRNGLYELTWFDGKMDKIALAYAGYGKLPKELTQEEN